MPDRCGGYGGLSSAWCCSSVGLADALCPGFAASLADTHLSSESAPELSTASAGAACFGFGGLRFGCIARTGDGLKEMEAAWQPWCF